MHKVVNQQTVVYNSSSKSRNYRLFIIIIQNNLGVVTPIIEQTTPL